MKKYIDSFKQISLANKITLLRLALVPVCVMFLLLSLYGLAAVTFLFLSFSDALDGYIARKYYQVSEIGKLLDPLADKILVISVLIALTGLGKADPVPVILISAREFIIASVRGRQIFAASPVAKWKTVIQVLAVFMIILNLPLAGLALWIAVALSLVSGGAYLWQSELIKQLKTT
ncbi:MAG: CDP-diacylglycerol--glycerol-3-phosphate 3-phosphatidyltransferase [Candidatus Margulisbacteria bacterium]|nr:CDP-diacylglycerol--glycerol-3-phosphate 3-phosphatidyltransferase [Candidatus Margulisiibacteriota bacterium]MBU1617663.1 CDP-diacylglycerol--glycerol-3-phosphate 3-phosphatidyltransferase [Candidatus Margulisiibacteriota bacterium]MBU1867381.1 CDP-diacylglycerol--glycerol-3-phosphate 3-phosphatidyltransferase [Candidatus Margulisiibacteriota bacterium]